MYQLFQSHEFSLERQHYRRMKEEKILTKAYQEQIYNSWEHHSILWKDNRENKVKTCHADECMVIASDHKKTLEKKTEKQIFCLVTRTSHYKTRTVMHTQRYSTNNLDLCHPMEIL